MTSERECFVYITLPRRHRVHHRGEVPREQPERCPRRRVRLRPPVPGTPGRRRDRPGGVASGGSTVRDDSSGRVLRCNPRRHAGFLGPPGDRAPNAGPRPGGVRVPDGRSRRPHRRTRIRAVSRSAVDALAGQRGSGSSGPATRCRQGRCRSSGTGRPRGPPCRGTAAPRNVRRWGAPQNRGAGRRRSLDSEAVAAGRPLERAENRTWHAGPGAHLWPGRAGQPPGLRG